MFDDNQVNEIAQGRAFSNIQLQVAGKVRIYQDDIFLGIGELQLMGQLAPKRIFNLP